MKCFFLAIALLCLPLICLAHLTSWQAIEPGLAFIQIQQNGGEINAFKINLKNFHLESVNTKINAADFLSLKQAAIKHQAIIAVNGGFFTPELNPIGLRINQFEMTSPIKPISWWGIFYIQRQKAQIKSYQDFKYHKNIQFAIQAGPRLLVNGQILKLKPGRHTRTALGITPSGEVVIAVTNALKLDTADLAEIMKNQLDCWNAINLDGGTSSQLYANVKHIQLQLTSFVTVADVLLVVPN